VSIAASITINRVTVIGDSKDGITGHSRCRGARVTKSARMVKEMTQEQMLATRRTRGSTWAMGGEAGAVGETAATLGVVSVSIDMVRI